MAVPPGFYDLTFILVCKPVNAPQLTSDDLLAGSQVIHEITIPVQVLNPGQEPVNGQDGGRVKLKPLTVQTLTLISRAARDNPDLVPLLTIRESLVEPRMSLDEVKQLHVGLVDYLVSQINLISGLKEDGESWGHLVNSAFSQAHILLAKHFGWTPQQVSELTPAQVAVYLAGIEKLQTIEREG